MKQTNNKTKPKQAIEVQHNTNNIHELPCLKLSITRYIDLNIFDNIELHATGFNRQEAQKGLSFLMRNHKKLLNKRSAIERKNRPDDRPRGIG